MRSAAKSAPRAYGVKAWPVALIVGASWLVAVLSSSFDASSRDVLAQPRVPSTVAVVFRRLQSCSAALDAQHAHRASTPRTASRTCRWTAVAIAT